MKELGDIVENELKIHPDLQSSKFHTAMIKQYNKLEKNAQERTWSNIKFNTFKWGVMVPLVYGSLGGDLAHILGDRLQVDRKVAVITNAIATATTDSIFTLTSSEALDATFYAKIGITQGWNMYRLLHDERKKPRIAIGFETLVALTPYSKYLAKKAINVLGDTNIIKKAVRKTNENINHVKEYYKNQSFIKQQPVFTTVIEEGAREMKKTFYAIAPLLMYCSTTKKS